MDNSQKIISALLELKTASLQSQENPKPLMEKYDMLFLGKNFNHIGSRELCFTLSEYFNISITLEDLHRILPSICESLNMPCEPMKAVNDLNNPDPAEYSIALF